MLYTLTQLILFTVSPTYVFDVEVEVPELKFLLAWRSNGDQNDETTGRSPAYGIASVGHESPYRLQAMADQITRSRIKYPLNVETYARV
jgi:hypothetical protein